MHFKVFVRLVGGLLAGGWALALSAGAAAPPQIKHDPVSVALRDQPLSILAQVQAPSGKVKSVTLMYTLSKDAAPFKLPMQATGAQTYLGTLPAGLMANAEKVWYYLEATDSLDASTETPWYVVTIKDSQALAAGGGGGVVRSKPDKEPGRASWVGPGLVAGGAAAIVGAALLVANRSSGSDSGTAAPTNAPGRYIGTKTICLNMPGTVPQCVSSATAIIIDQQGSVSSDSLVDGQYLTGTLSGSSFSMTGSTTTSNLVSQLQFSGTLVGQRLVGSITGTAQTSTNQGTYSGVFTADKQ